VDGYISQHLNIGFETLRLSSAGLVGWSGTLLSKEGDRQGSGLRLRTAKPVTGSMLKASLKFRTDSLYGDMTTSRTEYIFGLNTRVENRNCSGQSPDVPPTNVRYTYGPQRAYIHNRDLGYGFEIDIDAYIYTAWRANEYGSPAWIKPRDEAPEHSGSTVHCHIDTVDTGERKIIFGQTARRVITKNTSRRDLELTSESESDGWYIDAPAAWLKLHPPPEQGAYLILTVGNKRDDYRFTESGERETGFPILVLRKHRPYFRDQDGVVRSHEHLHRDEVTEFSEAPLDPDVFIPPRDFKRVMQLGGSVRHTLSERLRLRWEMLKDRHLRARLW